MLKKGIDFIDLEYDLRELNHQLVSWLMYVVNLRKILKRVQHVCSTDDCRGMLYHLHIP